MTKKNISLVLAIIGVLIVYNFPSIISFFTLSEGIQQFDKNYPEKDYQSEASLMLRNFGVKHEIDHEGVLRYNRKDQEIIEDVYNKIEKQHKPDWPNIFWANQNKKNQLIEFLSMNNIPFLVRKKDSSGGDYILWPPKFDPIVKEFNEKLLQDIKNNQQNI